MPIPPGPGASIFIDTRCYNKNRMETERIESRGAEMRELDLDTLMFFEGHLDALDLYRSFEAHPIV